MCERGEEGQNLCANSRIKGCAQARKEAEDWRDGRRLKEREKTC